ncbi:MAG: hypothetical protein JNG86_11555, partial [Verrucomicrobiaceae bacterium]|nr:hypothetical protein [Verrucomicrobiaceae bacterium]
MISASLPPPPRWLPARVLIAGLLVAGILSASGGTSFFSAWSPLSDSSLLGRGGRSGLVLIAALATAASAGFTITWLAQFGGAVVSVIVSFVGRALALFPVAALAWALVGWWIGVLSLPVETLMPAQFDSAVKDAQMALGVTLWEYLAPALVLAVPLLGEVVAAAGVPLRARLLSICLLAPAWLVLVEDVLHFPGLGGWMAQEIRTGEIAHVAACFSGFTLLTAALCLLVRAIPSGQKSGTSHLQSLCWLPWPL